MLNLLGRYHNNHKNAQISEGKTYFLLLLKGNLDSVGYSVHRYWDDRVVQRFVGSSPDFRPIHLPESLTLYCSRQVRSCIISFIYAQVNRPWNRLK